MLIGLFKTAVFIFPFFKELFLGKENPNGVKTGAFHAIFKKIVIAVGCAAFVTNVYLLNRLYTLAQQHVALNREIAQLRAAGVKAPVVVKKEHLAPPAPAPLLAAVPVEPEPLPAPPALPPAPAARPRAIKLARHQAVLPAPPPIHEDLARLRQLNAIE